MICEGCNTEVKSLQRHHWHENDMLKIKEICFVCNRVLGPAERWDNWDVQLQFLQVRYKSCSREEMEKDVLNKLHKRAEFKRRIGEYLRLHPSFDLEMFLRKNEDVEDEYNRKNWRSSPRGYWKGTREEELLRTSLLKHPEKNFAELCKLDDIVRARYCEKLATIRVQFELDEESPSVDDFKLYRQRVVRNSSTRKLLRQNSRKCLRDFQLTNPGKYAELMAKAQEELKKE